MRASPTQVGARMANNSSPSGICDYAIGLMLRTLSAHTNPCDLSSQSQKVMVTDESNVVSMTTLELTSPS